MQVAGGDIPILTVVMPRIRIGPGHPSEHQPRIREIQPALGESPGPFGGVEADIHGIIVSTKTSEVNWRQRRPDSLFESEPSGQWTYWATMAPLRYGGWMAFPRITVDPAICTGKPCIRGLRFPVARLLGLLAAGETREAILANYPYLESEDIDAALRYAAFLAEDETLELVR